MLSKVVESSYCLFIIRRIALLIILLSTTSHAKVLIFTYAYNRPDFLYLQNRTFQFFMEDEYELIVFNDASSEKDSELIRAMCLSLNLKCIDIPQEIHTRSYLHRPSSGIFADFNQPSVRNSNVVQYSLDMHGFQHNDIVMLVDSDIFLVKKFSIRDFMKDHHITGFLKNCCSDTRKKKLHTNKPHVQHIWIGLVGINMQTAPSKEVLNFNCGILKTRKLDAGGFTNYYISHQEEVKVKPIERTCLRELICKSCNENQNLFCTHNTDFLLESGYNKEFVTFLQKTPILHGKNQFRNSEFFLNNTFVHYRAGSNYNNTSNDFSVAKTNAFNEFIDQLLVGSA